MAERPVIGLGELLWDVFPDGKRPGGAPANFAFQAEQLGCRGLVATRVGRDQAGDEIVDFLKSKGVETTAVQRDADHPTGYVTVELSDSGHPDYTIHEGVAWDYLEMEDSLKSAMSEARAVCFGTLAQREQVSRETIHAAVGMVPNDCLKVYDVNLRQSYFQADWIEDSLRLANVVKLNDEEVIQLAKLLDLPQDETEFAQAVIKKWPPRLVCITRGGKGCLAVSADEVHEVPGRTIKVADTVGAGDAFTGGLVYSLLHEWPLQLCVEFANRVGGLVASRQGGMPEVADEYRQLIAQYGP